MILMIERKTSEDIITGEENRALVVVRREMKSLVVREEENIIENIRITRRKYPMMTISNL
jgi:hypothetical protein